MRDVVIAGTVRSRLLQYSRPSHAAAAPRDSANNRFPVHRVSSVNSASKTPHSSAGSECGAVAPLSQRPRCIKGVGSSTRPPHAVNAAS